MNASRVGDPRLVSTPRWLKSYKEAVLEADDAELKTKAEEAELALFLRLQELATDHSGNHHCERSAIQAALAGLRRLQVERLDFPLFPNETKSHESTESC